MAQAVLLTGDNPSLAQAELEAHLGQATWVRPRIAVVDAPRDAIRRLAYLREAMDLWADAPDTEHGLAALKAAVGDRAPGNASVAVATHRLDKSKNSRSVMHALGGALAEAGHPIHLDAPEMTLAAWFDDGIWIGPRIAQAHKRFQDRGVEQRAHFSPVSLHPRVASALVHLTGCQPGATVYDPFCGTGGIVLEAAIDGYRVLASDLDPWMVQGTMTTLTDAADEPLEGEVFVADIGDAPALVGTVDGIVTDLPYGGASTTNREALAALYERAFTAFAAMLPPGARAVIGHADETLLAPITQFGFELEQVHEQYVHKSMTRRFAVVKRQP